MSSGNCGSKQLDTTTHLSGWPKPQTLIMSNAKQSLTRLRETSSGVLCFLGYWATYFPHLSEHGSACVGGFSSLGSLARDAVGCSLKSSRHSPPSRHPASAKGHVSPGSVRPMPRFCRLFSSVIYNSLLQADRWYS